MTLAILAFLFATTLVLAGYAAVMHLPPWLAKRRMQRRLREVSDPAADPGSTTVVMSQAEGPVPMLDRMAAATSAGGKLATLIEQSGAQTTPSAIIAMSVGAAVVCGVLGLLLVHQMIGVIVGAVLGLIAPTLWLMRRRSVRLKRFEEQFP